MSWFGSQLTSDQHDVIDLVDSLTTAFAESLEGHGEHAGGDAPDVVAQCRSALAEAGIWSIGMTDEQGGGDAPLEVRLTALVALGAKAAALAWSCAQAHAAVETLSFRADTADLVAGIVAGSASVCVIDQSAVNVELSLAEGRITGTLARLDPAGETPHVVVLAGQSTAWLLPPSALNSVTALERTGMSGALSVSAAVDGEFDPEQFLIAGAPVDEIRARLHLSGAAIASGLTVEAAQRSLGYSQTRIQFGAPLTALPMVRMALAGQVGHAVESLAVLFAADDASPARAAIALWDNCERAIQTAGAAIQSHGGYGYLQEYGVERILRDAISLRAAADCLGASRMAASWLAGGELDQSAPFFSTAEVNA